MFSGFTRRCNQVPSCSLRASLRLLHSSCSNSQQRSRSRAGGGGGGGHSHHHHSSSSMRWRPATAALAAAAAAGFSFKEHGISEERVRQSQGQEDYDESHLLREGWEMLYEERNLHVYRRKREGYSYETFEYRCQGSYTDISPRHFLAVQNDVSVRAEWDKNVIRLEQIGDDGANEQLIRWVARYPYPLYPREYVYVRRSVVSGDGRNIVIQSAALPESVVPLSGNYVRVACYESRMCVRCHKDFDTNGLDYVLTYFDNPEANIPSYAYNWIVNQAGPYFIKQVYVEARKLAASGREVASVIRMRRKEEAAAAAAPTTRAETTGESEEEGTVAADAGAEAKAVVVLPGSPLIPTGDDGPVKRGERREEGGEEEEGKEEEKKEEEVVEEEWVIVEEPVEESALPGRRIFK